jgi:hypothetical protein
MRTVVLVPACTVRRRTSVVGSGRSARTSDTSRREPRRNWEGPFGQSRNTSRRTGRFGVKVTVSRPVTDVNAAATRMSTT